MSIRRSHEVINLCNQATENEKALRRFSLAKLKRVAIVTNSESTSSDEFRDVGVPSVTEALSIAEVIAASVLLGIQIYVYFEAATTWKISLWLNFLFDWGSLLLFYGTGIFTFVTLKHPSKSRFQWSIAFQIVSGFAAFIILMQSVASSLPMQNDDTMMQEQSDYSSNQSVRLINFIKITIGTLMALVVCIIIFLLSRATSCCSNFCCGCDKKAVIFDMASESQPSMP